MLVCLKRDASGPFRRSVKVEGQETIVLVFNPLEPLDLEGEELASVLPAIGHVLDFCTIRPAVKSEKGVVVRPEMPWPVLDQEENAKLMAEAEASVKKFRATKKASPPPEASPPEAEHQHQHQHPHQAKGGKKVAMPTERECIEDDITAGILAAPEFMETVTRYPMGVVANAVVIDNAFVDRGREEGSNEVDGDGPTPDSMAGRRVRATYYLEIPNTVDVNLRDTWLIDGALFTTIRHIGRDKSVNGRQTLRIIGVDEIFTRQPRLRPTGHSLPLRRPELMPDFSDEFSTEFDTVSSPSGPGPGSGDDILGTSWLSYHLEAAVDLVAASPSFQAMVGEPGDFDAARLRVYYPVADDATNGSGSMLEPRPRCIVNPCTEWEKHYGSGMNRGNVFVSFEVNIDEESIPTRRRQIMSFLNTVGLILEEMFGNARLDVPGTSPARTFLNLVAVHVVQGPAECERENQNDQLFYGITFLVNWV